jgi:hypothetical protein
MQKKNIRLIILHASHLEGLGFTHGRRFITCYHSLTTAQCYTATMQRLFIPGGDCLAKPKVGSSEERRARKSFYHLPTNLHVLLTYSLTGDTISMSTIPEDLEDTQISRGNLPGLATGSVLSHFVYASSNGDQLGYQRTLLSLCYLLLLYIPRNALTPSQQ